MSAFGTEILSGRSCFHPQKISFADFQTLYAKSKGTKLNQLWCRQLRQVGAVELFLSADPALYCGKDIDHSQALPHARLAHACLQGAVLGQGKRRAAQIAV